MRRHKVTGEQVGGVDEAGGLDVAGVVSGMSPQPVAECAGAHGGEFADPSVAYVAGVVRGKVRRVARFVAARRAVPPGGPPSTGQKKLRVLNPILRLYRIQPTGKSFRMRVEMG